MAINAGKAIGTVATLGSSVAAGAAAGSVVPIVGTAIGAGVGALASVFSSKKQASTAEKTSQWQIEAANEAARLQKQASDDSLAFLKQQDALDRADAEVKRKSAWDSDEFTRSTDVARNNTRQGNLQPYLGMGNAALGSLGNKMGFKPEQMQTGWTSTPYTPTPYTPLPSSQTPTTPAPGSPTSLSSLASPPAASSSQTVLMRAPNGKVAPVPPEMVEQYTKLGAVVVQG